MDIPETRHARNGENVLAYQVLASQTVEDLVAGSGLTFKDTHEHELKGDPETRRRVVG